MKLAYSEKFNRVVWTEAEGAEHLLQNVPHALMVAPFTWTAPCTIESQAVAAQLKLPAYSPILVKGNYDWPRAPFIKAPFAHQYEMAAMLTLHHRMHNLAEIGTGKTLGCLWAADFLMRGKHLRKVLVVGPLSTVNSVWRNHIGEHFSGLRRSAVCAEDKRKRVAALNDNRADFYIMNNESLTLPYVQDALKERDDIDLIIIDESDRYRNRRTDRYQAMEDYRGNRAMWLNTGTPTPQLPTDAWAQQNLIAKPPVTYRQFEDRTTFKVGNFKRVATSFAVDEVTKLLTPAIRFLRKDCIDLPPTQVISQQCDMTADQLKALRTLKRELRLQFPDGTQVNALNEGVLRGKIMQVMAGAVYDQKHEIHLVDSKPRIEMAKLLIASSPGKALVFTHLTSIAKALHVELGGALVIGATSLGARTKIFDDFQHSGDPQVIVADARCMSHGLTLTAADKIIWYSPCDSAGTYVQANGRITRPGQEREQMIYQLWVDVLEKQIYKRLGNREALQGLVMSWLEDDDFN